MRIQGGLANQMFQYTFFNWLVQKHKENKLNIDAYCDTSMYYNKIPKQECDPIHNGYELEEVFGIQTKVADLSDVYKLSQYRYNLPGKAAMKLRLKLLGPLSSQIADDEKGSYHLDYASLDNVYFCGTWGGFQYAEEYESNIRDIFRFPEIVDKRNQDAFNEISGTNSVSVHVRRGDYLKVGGGIALDKRYWENAIKEMREKVDNPVFFFFSDDIDWCRQSFGGNDIRFIDWNKGKQSFRDMQLMSLCRHNIIANSTFSLWASWLNNNKDKIVISPKGPGSCWETGENGEN